MIGIFCEPCEEFDNYHIKNHFKEIYNNLSM